MPQVVSNGGLFTGQSDQNNLPVVVNMVGNTPPSAWTGPTGAGNVIIGPTNCGWGSTYLNTSGTSLVTSRFVLIQGTWTGG
jgi:hypothetical protein